MKAVHPRWAAIVLAAGASTRMGQPKALLPWQGTTLLNWCVREARAAGVADLVVVLGPSFSRIEPTLGDRTTLKLGYNLDVETGRSNSIRIGAAQVDDAAAAIVVQSVDQPCPARVLVALLEAIGGGSAEVAIPVYEGRRGHPVCFAGRLLPELRAVSEATQGLRAVVHGADRVVEVPVDSAAVCWNLNDPAAYAAAVAATAQP